jgi:hypothetical protein
VTGPDALPEVMQDDIDAILASLQSLGERLRQARAALAPLEAGLAAARREFDERVGPLRREALRIEHEIAALRTPLPDVAREYAALTNADYAQDRTVDGRLTSSGDVDAIEKDVLLEHLVRVLDPDTDRQASVLLATVQGLCNDPAANLADVLEELPWGLAWIARARNEGLAAQHRRLTVWEAALRRQHTALNRVHEQLSEHDPRYRLYQERQRGPEAWEAYLARAAAQQREQNQELREELDELRGVRAGNDP